MDKLVIGYVFTRLLRSEEVHRLPAWAKASLMAQVYHRTNTKGMKVMGSKTLKEPLSETEIAILLSSIDSQTTWGARNSCMVVMLLDTGLRFSEILNITMENLHLEKTYAKVIGKGQKERIVPFGSSAQKALMKYIYHFRPDPITEDRLFLNLDGSPMTRTGLRQMIQRLAQSSGYLGCIPTFSDIHSPLTTS